jgi:hypothetical protein
MFKSVLMLVKFEYKKILSWHHKILVSKPKYVALTNGMEISITYYRKQGLLTLLSYKEALSRDLGRKCSIF